MTTRPAYREYPDWREHGVPRTTTQREFLDWCDGFLEDLLFEGLRTTKRGIYYRQQNLFGLDERQVAYQVGNALLRGELPWNALTDEGRKVADYRTYPDADSALADLRNEFAMDLWRGQRWRPLVLVEKAALVGVVASICEPERVAYAACRGDAGDVFIHNDLCAWLAPHMERDQGIRVLYLTDLNPSGVVAPTARRARPSASRAVAVCRSIGGSVIPASRSDGEGRRRRIRTPAGASSPRCRRPPTEQNDGPDDRSPA